MKQLWAFLGVTLGCSCLFPLSAQASCFEIKESSYTIGYTYREDRLNWNFSGPNDTPNVLSELNWSDIAINQVTFSTHLTMCNHFYFRGYGDYGSVFHGKNRDSDYDENDRQEEFSRVYSKAGRGEVFDLSAGVGYQFSCCCEKMRLAPLFGLSWQEQHLRMYDAQQVVPFSEKIKNLHSSYKTRWWGPFVGGDLFGQVSSNFSLFVSFEYHWVPYQGKGHWNLRDDILSDFKHCSNGRGFVTRGGVNYNICGGWSITLLTSYQDWCAKNGTHRIEVVNGERERVTLKARLNDVNWSSFQAGFLVTYSY